MRRLFTGLLTLGLFISAPARGDEPVFSGPQAGEKLTPFTMTGVFDQSAGNAIDLVSTAAGKPILLVFVHEANCPSIAVSRALLNYRRLARATALSAVSSGSPTIRPRPISF